MGAGSKMNITLKCLILERYSTQRDFALIVGIPEQDISNIVRGVREAREDEKEKITAELDLPAKKIFG